MKPRLVIASHKGGVGKSTISLNLAVALARRGYRTVLVDLDPQAALNISLKKGNMEYPGLAEIIWKNESPEKVLLKSALPNLSLLTKGRLAMKNIPQYEKQLFNGHVLAPLCEALERDHDLILFDTPAGLGMIPRAAFRVGSHVLVPFKVDTMNLRSINQILQVIEFVQKEENPALNYLGMVLNMFEKDKKASYRIAGEVWKDFPMVLDTTIPNAEIFHKASELGAPLALLGRGGHPEARRFDALAQEVLSLLDPVEETYEDVRQLL